MEVAVFARVNVAACLMSLAIQMPTPSDADWQWFYRNNDAALEALMPLNPSSKPLVAYLGYDSFRVEVQERYFRIDFAAMEAGFDKDRLTATVVVPVGRSIEQQLLEGHMKDRRASFKSLLSLVAVRRLTFSAANCAAVRTRMDALSTTPVSLPERDSLFIHPVVHRIVISMMAINIDATVQDPDIAIVRWATETADALLACAG